MNHEVEESYRWCRQLAEQSGSSFYRSFSLLSPERRRAMEAFYAFARLTDDIGDSPDTVSPHGTDDIHQQRAKMLAAWKQKVSFIAAENGTELPCPTADGQSLDEADAKLIQRWDSLWPALHDTLHRFHIPPQLLIELIEGVELDLQAQVIQSYEDLQKYCYHVAATVGLCCLYIWGADVAAIGKPAIQCGVAFQLTNILRDFGADADNGRIYIPRDDLAKAGISPENWLAKTPGDNWKDVFQINVQRARSEYLAAWPIVHHLKDDGQRMFSLIFRSYLEILHSIEAHPESVWDNPVKPSKLKLTAFYLCHVNPWLYRFLPSPRVIR